MQEPFKVSIRVKPYEGRSRFLTQRIGKETIIQVECPTQTIRDPDTYEQRSFAFDNVFNDGESTQDIYDQAISQMIYDCVSQGYNGTILAYGQTGSGKSYTMFGNLYDPLVENDGLVSMVLEQLFQMNVKISISYLEIYNEQIRDLIGDQVGLQLNEDPIKGVMLQDVQELQIMTIDQAKSIIINGNQKRVMAATNANQFSSRSHAIIQLFVVNQQYQCKLSLVDLAGSEKANVNEGSKGIRQMEGANINKSLLALGNCINMLACDQSIKKFVPYRDSKLTRLLKDSLGGNTKTLMIGCVQQVVQCHEESINTLKYASRARAIKKKIVQNIKINDITNCNCNCNSENVGLLQAEIEALKQEVSFQYQLTEEEIEIRLNLKQIDQLQLQNREGLEYLLQQMNSEMIDEDRLKNEILQYERAINENERIRQELNSQLQSKKKERTDPKDIQIEMLKKEITFLRDQIKQKDLVIDSLKIDKDNIKQSRPHTSYQETDRPKMNKENSIEIDVRKDSLQYCGSSKSIKQPTNREEEQHLQKLNKARDNYKIFRAKMIQLQEKMNYYTKNDIHLNQNQLKEIIDMMNELSTQNGPVLKQDEEMIIYFQKFIISQTQKSQQQINQNTLNTQITTPQQRSRSVNPNPDLAGSEKANVNEGSKGIRQMEGANINKSLLALGNCINMLACDQSMKKFVPYRDSKLTRLLKDSLGGNTKTLMIGCVQQVVQCHEESINTLKYASRARAIKKKIVQNIKINDITNCNCNCNSENVGLLQAEIEALKQEVSFQYQLTEEEIEIRLNLKQIDQLQLQNREGLEYLLQQMNSEMIDEDRLKNEILQYERAINENERIRQELNSQLQSKKKERTDPKDIQIEMLKKEITFLRDQIKQKDLVIDSLKIDKDNIKQSRPHTSYQETDRPKMNKENSIEIDVRKDSLQYCGSSKSIKQPTNREEEQHLQKLNKARDNYKIFRAKMIQLQEKMNYYTKNDIHLNQNQLKEIIDMMNELSTQNGPVLKQDEEMIIYFQKFIISQTQKSQQQINQNTLNTQITTPQQRSRSVNPNPNRGKGTSQHQRKPLQPTNQSPMNRQLFSNHTKQYQQLVQKGKKESCPTPQNKQKFILEYVKKMENQIPRGSNKSPLQSFSSDNSDKDDIIKRSFVQKVPFQSIQ
ncbi:unnamed protein product [Paramecium primaurelia]|uniref:Kinesin motor domain-containing protein n=1 Tax=Paramecium primaurelia TaxID=5886 RepID=A0A8S1JSA2_PARPR|nr:unnamed protein product [Paramecium primaurelia]